MTVSITQNEFVLCPPNGAKFTVHLDGYVHVEFQRGRESEVKAWLAKEVQNINTEWVDPRIRQQIEQSKLAAAMVTYAPTAQPVPAAKLSSSDPNFNPCGAMSAGRVQCKLQAGHLVNEDGSGHVFE